MVVNWADREQFLAGSKPMIAGVRNLASRFGDDQQLVLPSFSVQYHGGAGFPGRPSPDQMGFCWLWTLFVGLCFTSGVLIRERRDDAGPRLCLRGGRGAGRPRGRWRWTTRGYPVERSGSPSRDHSGASIARSWWPRLLTLHHRGGWLGPPSSCGDRQYSWAGNLGSLGRDGPFTLSRAIQVRTSTLKGRQSAERRCAGQFSIGRLVCWLAAFTVRAGDSVISWLPIPEAGAGLTPSGSGSYACRGIEPSLVFMPDGGAVTTGMLKRGGSSRGRRGVGADRAFAEGGMLIAMPFVPRCGNGS